MSEANSEFCSCLCFFSKSQQDDLKIAPRIERKRDSIEFERSENQGQFFFARLLIILKFLNAFRLAEHLYFKGL
jgi:hypothetical protein